MHVWGTPCMYVQGSDTQIGTGGIVLHAHIHVLLQRTIHVHPVLPSHVGQVGLSHGIPCVPMHGPILVKILYVYVNV